MKKEKTIYMSIDRIDVIHICCPNLNFQFIDKGYILEKKNSACLPALYSYELYVHVCHV